MFAADSEAEAEAEAGRGSRAAAKTPGKLRAIESVPPSRLLADAQAEACADCIKNEKGRGAPTPTDRLASLGLVAAAAALDKDLLMFARSGLD